MCVRGCSASGRGVKDSARARVGCVRGRIIFMGNRRCIVRSWSAMAVGNTIEEGEEIFGGGLIGNVEGLMGCG